MKNRKIIYIDENGRVRLFSSLKTLYENETELKYHKYSVIYQLTRMKQKKAVIIGKGTIIRLAVNSDEFAQL